MIWLTHLLWTHFEKALYREGTDPQAGAASTLPSDLADTPVLERLWKGLVEGRGRRWGPEASFTRLRKSSHPVNEAPDQVIPHTPLGWGSCFATVLEGFCKGKGLWQPARALPRESWPLWWDLGGEMAAACKSAALVQSHCTAHGVSGAGSEVACSLLHRFMYTFLFTPLL